MAGPSSAQDVADALALTIERRDAAGRPWCPPRDGSLLRGWIIHRNEAFGGAIRRSVHLARAMCLASGQDHITVLYLHLPVLRARAFEQVFSSMLRAKRAGEEIALTGNGVRLRPMAGSSATQDFDIHFAQMPRLAALLDFLHNALGFAQVADLLAPIATRLPTKSPADVARQLQSVISAWLADRLESATHLRQAHRMRAFLASRGPVGPDAIDDAAILAFWSEIVAAGEEARSEDFRLFRSAARSMLRYRLALAEAAAESELEAALTFGQGSQDDLERITADASPLTSSAPWHSPLRALATPPLDRVKWLTQREVHRLRNAFGHPPSDADADEPADADDVGDWIGGIAGDERFDHRFALTLLRVDVFGAAQASAVARLRRRVAAEAAVAQAMAAVATDAYRACANAYEAVRQQLQLEAYAALLPLLSNGSLEALALLEHLRGRAVVSAVLAASGIETIEGDGEELEEAIRARLAAGLRAAMQGTVTPAAFRDAVEAARNAARKVSREGFRREDLADPEAREALCAGVPFVIELARDLSRLATSLHAQADRDGFAADRETFHQSFLMLYGPRATA